MKIDLHGVKHIDAPDVIMQTIEDNLHHNVILTFIVGNSPEMSQMVYIAAEGYKLKTNSLISTEISITTDNRRDR
jgi:hypothetical protein